MCHQLLKDSRLWSFLHQIDTDLAHETREGGCTYCGAPLHCADYPRKPRGGPEALPWEYRFRFSLCCSAERCRRRSTPPSVRFLGRKIYLKVVVILLTAMRQGPTPQGAKVLHRLYGASRRTLARWQVWWKEIFPLTLFWKKVGARFLPPLRDEALPSALLDSMDARSSLEKFLELLRFLSPITTQKGLQLYLS